MTRKRMAIIGAVLIGILLLCACAGTVGYLLMNTPLGPVLQNETQIPPAEIPQATVNPSSSISTAISSPTVGEVANCGVKGSINILIMGVDSPFDNGLKGPLAIRLVKLDFSQKSASVFSFPRDLWIPVTGLESYGIHQARLGEIYLIAHSNAGLNEAAATNLVVQNLSRNFGAESDHYIVGKVATLAAIIDTVGGITVPVPVVHDATSYGMHYFPAGPYHMGGLIALEYAISPTSAGQWDGFDRQTLVLDTLYQRFLSPDILPKLPVLIPQFLQLGTTDLSIQQFLNIMCISQQIPRERITFAEVEPGDVTFGASGVLYPNFEIIRSKVQQTLAPSQP